MKVKFRVNYHPELRYEFDVDHVLMYSGCVYFYEKGRSHYYLKYDGSTKTMTVYDKRYCIDTPQKYVTSRWDLGEL